MNDLGGAHPCGPIGQYGRSCLSLNPGIRRKNIGYGLFGVRVRCRLIIMIKHNTPPYACWRC